MDASQLRQLFDNLQLPESTWPEFCQNIRQSAMPRHSPGARLMADGAASLLAHTWYVVPDGTAVQRPQTGSRPGDPNADALFSFIMAKILTRIQTRLQQEQLVDDPVVGNWCLSASATWVDDATFLVQADAASLLRKGGGTMSVILDTLVEFGMRISSGPHKTAVLMEYAGPGAVQHRRALESTHPHCLHIFSEHQRVAREDSWLAGVHRAVQWWHQQVGAELLPEALTRLHTEAAWDDLASQAMTLKKRLLDAKKVHLMHLQAYVELKDASSQQAVLLHDMGWTTSAPVDTPSAPDVPVWHCEECDMSFNGATALAVHNRHRHSRGAAARRFAVDSACRVCRKYFHSRPRLIQHWHSSDTMCWITVFRRFEPMSVEQTMALDEADRHAGQALHQKGVKDHAVDRIWRWCTAEEMQPVLPLLPMEQVGPVLPEEEARWTLLGALPTSHFGRSRQVHPECDPAVPHAHQDLQDLEGQLCSQLSLWTAPPEDIPRPLALNSRFALLLFSGHRRPHDIACWLWWKTNLQPICVDTAIDQTAGNIFESHVWTSLIKSRTVVAAHAAPPCETYTEARWNDVPMSDGRMPPRPLRDASSPWGMLHRQPREVRQCLYGTILMLRALVLVAMVFATGGCFSLEHPRGAPEGTGRRAVAHWTWWRPE
eukprot:Skav225443  [mRNA]  locus=scaffold1668:184940:187950:+ [translate_table: standard]